MRYVAKRKSDIKIGSRAYEEFCRIFEPEKHGRMKKAIKLMGCDHKTPYAWRDGTAPDAIYLQRLCELGADVTWILTGIKKECNHGQ